MALGGKAVCEGLVPRTAVRPPGGATNGMKLVQAKPISPASAARQRTTATKSCQSRTAATATPERSRARLIHHRIARVGAPGPHPLSPSRRSAPAVSRTTRTRGRGFSVPSR